jgi:hypothetical protein
MKIGFNCHIVYDKGDVKEEPSINEVLAKLSRGELKIEKIDLWFAEPYILVSDKNKK